jgi:hypothetical protein
MRDVQPGYMGFLCNEKMLEHGINVGFVVLSKIRDGRDFYFKFENSLHKLHTVLNV